MRSVAPLTFKLLLTLCLFSQAGYSLDPSRTLDQFHQTKWTSRDGAPSQIVALAQTGDGFLWIGTSRGLFRFDGITFERFAAPSGEALPSANIYSLKTSPEGGLWVSFRPSGLGYIRNGEIEIFNTTETLPRTQVHCFGIDGKQRVWAGTHEGLVIRREDGSWTDVGEEWGFTPRRVHSMFTDSSRRMWVAVEDGGLYMLPPDTDRFVAVERGENVITSFTEAPDGRVWRSDYGGLFRPIALPSSNVSEIGIKNSRFLSSSLFDRDGVLWFTDHAGIKRIREPLQFKVGNLSPGDPRVEVLDLGDDLPGPLLEDREGNIWVGSPQGLIRFRYSYFIPNKVSFRYRNITLAPDQSSGVWVGSSLRLPLAHINGETIRTFSTAMNISSVVRDEFGTIWWGAHSRLLRHRGTEITSFPQPPNLRKDWLWEVFPGIDGDSVCVRAGDTGLIEFKDGKWVSRRQPSGLPDRGPSASFSEGTGRTWLGYTENRVAVIEGNTAKLFTPDDGIDVGRIRVIRKAADRIWIGGELGLAIFDGSRVHSIKTNRGERFGTVSGIVTARDGSLWLNEVQGIVRIEKEELEELIRDPLREVAFRRFDFEDGLPGAPQMNWTVSTAVESADGRLWFATDGGLVSTDPLNLVANPLPPPVSIRSLAVGETRYDIHKPVELPQGTEDLTIEYTALSLSIPERVQFRYILEGVDSDWRDANTRRTAFYTNLAPGEYRFRVVASNNDGVWNEQEALLLFTILPQFYQTNWFVALCILTAAGIALIIIRWRLKELKYRLNLQFEERIAERGRIAQDLHDTLLQGFVGASMQMDVAVDTLRDETQKSRFERIHEMIKRQIREGRETVKGLRFDSDMMPSELQEVFKRTREELDQDHLVEFRVSVTGHPRRLHPIVHEEVQHIGQEAIFNAFRHSRAARIDVMIEYSARRFYLRVKDDGRGIDQEFISSGRDGHWGLIGMRERAEKIGGYFKIWSTDGRGTEIELTIPRRLAYVYDDKESLPRLSIRNFLWR